MLTISRPRNLLAGTLPLAAAFVLAPVLRAQSVPVPFAATYAGAGTVCATSLPVFAVSGTGAKYGDGCPATQATLNVPVAVATDSYGNVFIADQTDMLVRVVYNGGTALAAAIATSNVQNPGLVPQKGYIYTIAGGITTTPTEGTKYCNQAGSGVIGTGSQLDNCPGSESEQGPRGLAVDSDGNLFIASVSPNSQLRILYIGGTKAAALITLQNPTITSPIPGYVYNIAGANSSAYTGDGASATKASLNTPRGIFVDANENVYFADQLNLAIRRIDSTTGFISTVAGHNAGSVSSCTASGVTSSGDGAAATSATLACPYGLTIDQYGNIFIAEAGSGSTTIPGRVRVVYEGGTLPGITGAMGNIYTYAGAQTGSTQAEQAVFQEVFGVTLDNAGYLYVTDYRTGSTGSNHIWRVDPTNGNIAAIAGNGASALTTGNHCNGLTTGPTATDVRGDGCPATQAYLNLPQESLGFDAHGTFYVADRGNNAVRSFSYDNAFPATAVGSYVTQPLAFLYAAGSLPVTETFTTQGTAAADYSDAGGDTCALNTTQTATTTCVDYVKFAPIAAGQRPGSLSVASATATIATQSLSGVGTAPVLTIAPPTGVALGTAIQPLSISADQVGNAEISDGKGKQVLRTTIAGGTPTALITGLGLPRESTTDSYGNVFVADSTNNVIVEHTAAGASATFGTGLSAPQGVAADQLGNVYVADTGNNRLIYISPITGSQRTIAVSGFTLSAPTYLAMDASGDLYIVDTAATRVIEIPFGGVPQLVTLPSSAQPVAIAFDPGGDAYFADKVSGNILFVPTGSTTSTPLITGLTTPAAVAVDPNGNVYLADSSATSAAGYNFALNNSMFSTTNIQLTSLPITLTVGSVGNLSATLSTPPYVESGANAAAFQPTTPATCTAALVLATGTNCTQTFQFSPTAPGPQTAKAVFSDTTGQSVTANFSATATNLILTTTTLMLTNTGAVNYGQAATYKVTLTPASNGSSAPTGTIKFLVDGATNQTQTVATGPYTFTVQLAVGTHSIAAVYSGDAIYAGSNASTSITIGKAVTTTTASYTQTASGTVLGAVVTPASTGALTFTGNVIFYIDGVAVATVPVGNGTVSTTVLTTDGSHTYYAMYTGDANYAASSSTTQTLVVARTATTTTLTIMPVSSNGTAGLLLTAKVSTSGTGTPTGTVTFSNGATTLGTVNLSTAVNGVVTFTTSTTSYTSYVFTAAYSGDGLFQPSSATATEGPDFVLNAPTTALAVPGGGQATASFTVAPINGYTGTLTAACSNLPVNTICRFQPIPLTLTTTASATLSVQVFADVNPSVADVSHTPFATRAKAFLAFLLLAPLAFSIKRRKRSLPSLLALAFLAFIAASATGCGNKTPAVSTQTFVTPAGTTAVTVTLTDTNKVSRSAVFNVTVTAE
jgi:sugar lactone lactonase YvrE